MTDFILVLIVVAFFVLCVGYVRVCDRIMTRGTDADARESPEAIDDAREVVQP